MKLLIDERGTRATQEALAATATVATSDVSYVEARAAIARMRAGARIGPQEANAARGALDDLWLDLLRVAPDDTLLATAADLADAHSLRGYDSIQLATAELLRDAGELVFVCWDRELAAAAGRIGLRTEPSRS